MPAHARADSSSIGKLEPPLSLHLAQGIVEGVEQLVDVLGVHRSRESRDAAHRQLKSSVAKTEKGQQVVVEIGSLGSPRVANRHLGPVDLEKERRALRCTPRALQRRVLPND